MKIPSKNGLFSGYFGISNSASTPVGDLRESQQTYHPNVTNSHWTVFFSGWCSTPTLLRPFARHLGSGKLSSKQLMTAHHDQRSPVFFFKRQETHKAPFGVEMPQKFSTPRIPSGNADTPQQSTTGKNPKILLMVQKSLSHHLGWC